MRKKDDSTTITARISTKTYSTLMGYATAHGETLSSAACGLIEKVLYNLPPKSESEEIESLKRKLEDCAARSDRAEERVKAIAQANIRLIEERRALRAELERLTEELDKTRRAVPADASVAAPAVSAAPAAPAAKGIKRCLVRDAVVILEALSECISDECAMDCAASLAKSARHRLMEALK